MYFIAREQPITRQVSRFLQIFNKPITSHEVERQWRQCGQLPFFSFSGSIIRRKLCFSTTLFLQSTL